MLEQVRLWLDYMAVRLSYCILQAMPLELCSQVSGFLATLCVTAVPIRRKVVEENLMLAFPEWDAQRRRAVTWQMWKHLFMIVAELSHAARYIHETNWRRHIRLARGDELCRILLDRRPTLIVSAHFGNFEVGGIFLGLLGFDTHAVARTLDNPYLARFTDGLRTAGRQHIIPKKGGYDQILQVLATGGTMVFLADQYAGSKGCWVEFFNRPASAHKAIGLLALDKDARIVVCGCRRLPGPLQFELSVRNIFDPRTPGDCGGDIKQLTQWYTRELEQVIRTAPDQYWWVHRRWKDTRKKKKAAVLAGPHTAVQKEASNL
ncbi:MAG TPA: lysophospholipid acyltransferase family protein [Pirellulales bacterium]|jgi:KDO2-lipid IV(A) lauroyltransferase|nr:lysophospholipid acyltransferase family protein [Pirellulales bacterium]